MCCKKVWCVVVGCGDALHWKGAQGAHPVACQLLPAPAHPGTAAPEAWFSTTYLPAHPAAHLPPTPPTDGQGGGQRKVDADDPAGDVGGGGQVVVFVHDCRHRIKFEG